MTGAHLLDLGVPPRTQVEWVRTGKLVRLAPSAYLVPHLIDDLSQLQAVQFAYPHSVASHRAAAHLWRLDGIPSFALDVTVPYGAKPRLGTAHRSADLAEFEIATVGDLRVTDPTRTLCDLGATCSVNVLERATECALRRDLTSLPRLDWRCRQLAKPGRQGPRQLRMVLEQRPAGAPPTDSDLETLYLQCIRDRDVPMPVRQCRVIENGVVIARLDLAYPDRMVFVELDGWEWHRSRPAFVRDRRRQNRIVIARRWLPLRFTWDDVVGDPDRVAAETLAAIR